MKLVVIGVLFVQGFGMPQGETVTQPAGVRFDSLEQCAEFMAEFGADVAQALQDRSRVLQGEVWMTCAPGGYVATDKKGKAS